jgi:hypothetical protein
LKAFLPLAEKLFARGNVSINVLLKETGYFEVHSQINEANISNELKKHPEYINHWLNWSNNKRTNSGWFFKQENNGKYVVGYSPEKPDLNHFEYSDLPEACAAFIKLEIEEIRKGG